MSISVRKLKKSLKEKFLLHFFFCFSTPSLNYVQFPRTVFLKNLICSPPPDQSYHNTHVYFSFPQKSPTKSWSFTWKFLVFVIHFFIDSTKFTSNLIPFKPFHDTLWHLKLNFLSIFRVFFPRLPFIYLIFLIQPYHKAHKKHISSNFLLLKCNLLCKYLYFPILYRKMEGLEGDRNGKCIHFDASLSQ